MLRTHPVNQRRIKEIRKTVKSDYPELLTKAPDEFRQSSPRFMEILEGFHRRSEAYEFYDEAQKRFMEPGVDPEKPSRDVIAAARADLAEDDSS